MATAQTVSVRCPHCRRPLSGAADHAGKSIVCPGCGEEFRFPLLKSDAFRAEAARLGYRVIELAETKISPSVLAVVPEAVAREHALLPIALDGQTLTVAMAGPPSPDTVDRLRFTLNRPISVALARGEAIQAALDRCYAEPPDESAGPIAALGGDEPIDFVEVEESGGESGARAAMPDPDGAAVARLVQSIIAEALHLGASRILILPVKDRLKVVYRVRDAVVALDNPPPEMLYPVLVRLMTMTNLSGVIKVHLKEKERRLHVTFKPTRYGLSALVEIGRDGSVVEACRARAAKLGYPFVDLDKTQILPPVLDLVPEKVAREHRVLPVSLDGDRLTVAMADPQTPEAVDRLRFLLNRPLSVAMAPEGAILAALEAYYGPSDPEAADLMLWELAQPSPASAAEVGDSGELPKPRDVPQDHPARPLAVQLAAVFRDEAFDLFRELAAGPKLCRRVEGGDLDVVFSQAHLMSFLPAEARQYVEDKIWVLREAILSRLEHFLAKDAAARGIAMAYALDAACARLAAGEPASINPATARDEWVNFLYAFIVRHFPEIDSNGHLLAFTNKHLGHLAAKLAELVEDPKCVHDAQGARQFLARLQQQTSTDERIDRDSPPVVRQVELLVAEAAHVRASAVALVPAADRIEVAFRIQEAIHAREGLPLERLFPMLARLQMLAHADGEFRLAVGEAEQVVRLALVPTKLGLGARIDLVPDRVDVARCRAAAAEHGHRFVELEKVEVPESLLRRIPKAVAWQKRVLPLALEEGKLTVAVSGPPSARRMDELRLVFNRPVSVVMAPEADILAAIYRHYHEEAPSGSASPAAITILGG